MAIIDNMQKISDTVWELPPSYKEGMRVPARHDQHKPYPPKPKDQELIRAACAEITAGAALERVDSSVSE
jgi:hypothetical protein